MVFILKKESNSWSSIFSLILILNQYGVLYFLKLWYYTIEKATNWLKCLKTQKSKTYSQFTFICFLNIRIFETFYSLLCIIPVIVIKRFLWRYLSKLHIKSNDSLVGDFSGNNASTEWFFFVLPHSHNFLS